MSQETYIVLTVSTDDAVSFDPGGLESTKGGDATAGQPTEVRVETPQLSPREARDLRRDPKVKAAARPIPLRRILPVAQTDAEAAPPQHVSGVTWGVHVTGAQQSRFTGAGVTIGVIDSGIDETHPAFAGVELVQRDFTNEGGGDAGGHGTHVAGTIFGRPVGGVRFGVAPGVRRAMIAKVFGEKDDTSTKELVEAVQWAVSGGAQIINMSLGFDFPALSKQMIDNGYPADLATSQALALYRDSVRLFDTLAAALLAQSVFGFGALIVAAAGNESQRDISPLYTIEAGPPAASDQVLPVAAIGTAGQPHSALTVAPFSNVGAEIAAPGMGVYSAWPDGGFALLDGTSMASPHVAGIAALWAERQIERTGAVNVPQLASLLIGNAQLNRLAGAEDADVGAGLVSAPLD